MVAMKTALVPASALRMNGSLARNATAQDAASAAAGMVAKSAMAWEKLLFKRRALKIAPAAMEQAAYLKTIVTMYRPGGGSHSHSESTGKNVTRPITSICWVLDAFTAARITVRPLV